MTAANIVVVLTFLATFNEAALELVLGRWHNLLIDRLMPLASIALGIAECIGFGINALALIEGLDTWPLAGQVITGVVVGGGAGLVHRFFGKPSRTGDIV